MTSSGRGELRRVVRACPRGISPDSLVSRDGVARVIETMRTFDAVPAGMKIEPESVFDNRYVLKALGR